MKFERFYTKPKIKIEDQIKWKTCNAKINDSKGKTIFEMQNIEVPEQWSQTAVNIIAQKYFRKAGVPKYVIPSPEKNIPSWLSKSIPSYIVSYNEDELTHEISAKQVFHRLAGCWTYWGWKEGIFKDYPDCPKCDGSGFTGPETGYGGVCSECGGQKSTGPINSEEFAHVFYDELYYMLAMQIAAPNSPQWFNTGLFWAYGIKGEDSGQWTIDYDSHPNHSNLTQNDGITPLPPPAVRIHNSYERCQPHACFIQPVSDDLVNPGGIMDLWTREVRLFKHGSGTGTNFSNIRAKGEPLSGGGKSSGLMSFLKIGDVAAGAVQSGGVTRRAAKMCCLDMDHPEIEDFIKWKKREERKARAMSLGSQMLDDDGEFYSSEFEGEAINSVSGQNSNNSVRVTDDFLNRVDNNLEWSLKQRTDNKVTKTLFARDLWNQICFAAWSCADPGVQFHDTTNSWHTCKSDGDIHASNPCSEYMFLDSTACNLASLNLLTFLSRDGIFDVRAFEYSTRIWTVVLEISVYMASFPSKEIAEGSYNYRTLGLGYANLGGLLLRKNLGYDSEDGRNLAASITALMHAVAYQTSAEMAQELGPFPRWEANKECMTDVLKCHSLEVTLLKQSEIKSRCLEIWTELSDVEVMKHGYRNAQVTLLAPTGTIALLMDCETTGIEPFFSSKIIKNLAGGGQMEFENKVPESECAVGENCLRPMAHVLMVAAVQPFLSGAVSKTVNLPNSATVQDIDQIYREAHRLGLKAIAVYRDGSKMTQPMNTKTKEPTGGFLMTGEQKEKLNNAYQDAIESAWKKADSESEPNKKFPKSIAKPDEWFEELLKPFSENELKCSQRKPLPMRRGGYTQKLRVEDQVLYLRTGNYPDGSLGEIFVTLSREGSTVRSLMESFGKAISIGLQFGVPLQEFVDAFTHTKFEPSGVVQGHERIKMCSSIIDLIFRDLAVEYLKQDDLAHVKPKTEEEEILTPKPGDPFPQPIPSTIDIASGLPVFYAPPMTPELQALLTSEPQSKNTGDLCPECGNMSLVRVGTCQMCTVCPHNTGCG